MKLSTTERNIDQAIQRVYAAYGTDLNAFFQDVQRQAQMVDPSKKKKAAADLVPQSPPKTW